MQALDDAALKELGRLHTAQEALDAVKVARSIFERYSFDLIYARPRQTLAGWEAELKRAIAEAAEHLSLYQLTIEPDTPFFGLHKAGKLDRARTKTWAAISTISRKSVCADAGLPAYEISNHARPGAECRHNLVYWRGHDYVGVGPGAHGRLTIDGRRYATETEKRPEAWLMRVEENGTGLIVDEKLTRGETADEYLLMGLRLAEGIEPQRFTRDRRPHARSQAHFDPARRRRGGDHRRRPPARHAIGLPGARRGGGGSGGVASSSSPSCGDPAQTIAFMIRMTGKARAFSRPRLNDFGAGLTTWPPPGRHAAPPGRAHWCRRARKRNTPSMPAKPDELVSTCSVKRCAPCVFTSAATSATAS